MTDALTAPCVYCGQDVMPPMNVPHLDTCPSVTGIFPVMERDVMCTCRCGEVSHDAGLVCAECGIELKVGDHYADWTLEEASGEGIVGASIVQLVCLVCAATRGAHV